MLRIQTVFSLLFCSVVASAQVTLSPPFATQNEQVTITYDATAGNGQLTGQSVVYAHTGVITDLSSSPTDWKHVQGNWGTDDSRLKMTSIGNNKFTLTINISSFYGVPSNEKVLKLAFVFRNLAGTLVGRSADGGDIFVPLSQGGLQILFNAPSTKFSVINPGDSLHLSAYTSQKTNLSLYLNDSLVKQINGDSTIDFHTVASNVTTYTARLQAGSIADSVIWVVRNARVQFSPAGIVDGINYISDTSVILQLFAPGKSFVYAIGDFSSWKPDSRYDMIKFPDGQKFWVQINGLQPGKEYRFQYRIDQEGLRVADPYADKQLDPSNDPYISAATYPALIPYPVSLTNEFVSVFQTAQTPYVWQHTSGYTKPFATKLNIYELLVRDFIGKHDFATLIDTLDYLKRLGINAVEVMPFNEFEGNDSWGYNTIFYFAPDKYYGPKNNLKKFVDECHKRGMAVIMDMVLNHSFGQSSMVRMYFNQSTGKPAANSPWFNADATHPFNVGYDFNHESIFTQQLVDTVLRYWAKEYHIDGYRFDMSKGFTQKNTGTDVGAWGNYDPSRVALLKRMGNKFREACADCYMILEHFADNSEQTILSDFGFLLWGNMNYQFAQATMGYSSDLNGASYKTFAWKDPHLVVYNESHDEERLQYKNVNFGYASSQYDAKDTSTALARNEALASIFFSIPGPKMIWQFGEIGFDYSINYCMSNGSVNDACRTYPKPIRWDYFNQPARRRLHDVYEAMMNLRNQYPQFHTNSFTATLNGNYKVVRGNDSSMRFLTMANAGVLPNTQKPGFTALGWWYNYFSGDSMYVNALDTSISLQAGEYRVYTTNRLSKPFLTSTALSENNLSKYNWSVFPNPSEGEFYINLQSASATDCTISIFDLNGKQVYTSFSKTNNLPILIQPELQSGMYILKIEANGQTQSSKLILQKN